MRDDKPAHWPRVAAVVFDLDGVLVDSEPVFCRGLRAFLAPAALTDEQYVSIVGISEAETWHWVKTTYGQRESIEELSAASREFLYHALSAEPLAALAGAPELVRALRTAGCRLAVASQSSPRWVRTTLDAIGMADAFDYVVTASEVGAPKPAPDIYLHAASRLGVSSQACVAVEDSVPGIQSASAAGMRVVQLRQATHVADPHPLATSVIASHKDFPLAWLGTSIEA